MEKNQEKKDLILKAATECFGRYGYEKTTLEDIGKLVGLNKASIYYYYKNKESIFSDVIGNERGDYLRIVTRKVDPTADYVTKITTFLVERLKYAKHAINLFSLSAETLQSFQPVFQSLYQSLLEKEVGYITGILDQSCENGEIIQCDNQRVASNIITMADAIKQREAPCFDLRTKPGEYSSEAEKEVTFAVSLFLKGIKRS